MFNNTIKEKINVIENHKFEKLLESLGILDSVLNGSKKCKFCNQSTNIDDISSMFPESGDIKIVCSKVSCLKDFIRYRDMKKYGD